MIAPLLKPSQMKVAQPWIEIFDGGREVLNTKTARGRDEYRERTLQMWERQGRKCGLILHTFCKERRGRWSADSITFDHDNPRGVSGQDDRIDVFNPTTGEIEKQNHAACGWCNTVKGSRRRSLLIEQGLIAS